MVAILGEYEAVHLHCALMPFHSLAHLVQLGLQCQVLLLCLLLIVLHTSSTESPMFLITCLIVIVTTINSIFQLLLDSNFARFQVLIEIQIGRVPGSRVPSTCSSIATSAACCASTTA